MKPPWDAIVVGVGAMGAAALWCLASRGARVLGIERHWIGHDLGSSHGGSRIVRYAYFEHPAYVPLLVRSRDLWREIELASRTRIVHPCGVVYGGRASSEVLAGVKASARIHGIAIESIAPATIGERFGALAGCREEVDEYLFEPGAGFLRAERAIVAMTQSAQRRGACLRVGVRCESWRECEGLVEVAIEGRIEKTKALILCPGAWAASMSGLPSIRLHNTRQVIAWITPTNPQQCSEYKLPAFFVEREAGRPIYGVPMASDQATPLGVKVGLHGGGSACDPDTLDRSVTAAESEELSQALARAVPGAGGTVTATSVCMYTNTPDDHFIIDRIGAGPVYTAIGLCGHGFKFAPVIGEALAELALEGSTRHAIDFLRENRFSRG